MKNILLVAFTFITFTASQANAAIWISCGKGKVLDGGIFEKEEAQFSSEDDNFSGSLGGTWEMKLGHTDWLNPSKKVTAKTTEADGVTTVEINIVTGKANGKTPVGTRYVLTDIYTDEPTLEKFNLSGGFAGNTKTGTFKCVTGID